MSASDALSRKRTLWSTVLVVSLSGGTGTAQWTNRYPKVEGYSHHVYLEGYEFPFLNAGPSDPAPSPDGRTIAFSARGWLWILDLESKRARRLTDGAGMDFRPRWSPDAASIVFVRDDTRNTTLVRVDVASGAEEVLVQEPAILLDPIYSLDGRSILYSSAQAGDLDLWRMELASGEKTRLTEAKGLELCPLPVSEREVVFVSKAQTGDSVSVLDTSTGSSRVLIEESIGSLMRPALDPGRGSLVVPLPDPDRWALWLEDLAGGPRIRVTAGDGLPIMPAYSSDGATIYFVEADSDQRFRLKRVARGGGATVEVDPIVWDWGAPTTRVQIRTRAKGTLRPLAARLHVRDASGHPVVSETSQPRFDSESGKVYLYSNGVLDVEAPAGTLHVEATHGLSTPVETATVSAGAGESAVADLDLAPLWSGGEGGWYSGDHHFHLNYGGPYRLHPDSLLTVLAAEDLDVATPLMANLHTRLTDFEWASWTRLGPSPPLIAFGQEVRPHFLGHMGLIGISSPHWPWFWGPAYPVYGRDDRMNGSALEEARRQGGVNSFVHPVMAPEPFPEDGTPRNLPLALVPEAIHGLVDTLEIACLWSDERGTADAWYRLLNVGLPVAPSAGTDAFSNFYRSMTVGTTRVYVNVDGPLNFASYLEGLRRGRSFVTTGPFLDFEVSGSGPGEVLSGAGGSPADFRLTLISAVPVETVEVLVNGKVVWKDAGLAAPGRRTYTGKAPVPAGGWIAARAHGGEAVWPVMDSYPFAHTGAVWVNEVGSREDEAARRSARELLAWMAVAEARLVEGFGGAAIPALRERFSEARRKLEALAR
jgi:TolB protein